MKERFENYIDEQLKEIKGENKQAFKAKMIEKMTDYAQECKIKGMTDEELIFTYCIENVGDLQEKYLKTMEIKEQKAMAGRKTGIGIITFLSIIFAAVVAYLSVSFATKEWGITWLIIVGGVVAAVIASTIITVIGLAKKQQWIPIRIFIAIDVILVFVLVYLCLLMLTTIPKTYVLFLIMTVMVSGIDTAIAVGVNSKTRLISLLAFIQLATALEYVMLGILKMAPWHPYWLIPVGGLFINLIIIAVAIYFHFKNKKDKDAE